MRSQLGALLAAAALTVSTPLDAQTPAAAHDVFDNFGMPLGFSVAKMDPTADPRQDFVRFAAGRWLDVARIPGESPYVSGVMIMAKQSEAQVGVLLTDAAARSASATRGSPLQQVGDFYASGMDVERLAGLGATPLKPEWDRIAAIDGRTALARSVAHLTLILNEPILIGAGVTPDAQDTSRYAVAVSDGPLPLPARDDYLSPTPEMAQLRDAYLVLVTQAHVLAGLPVEEARARAAKVLAMETRIARSKLSEVDRADPRKLITRLSYADLKQLVPNFDVDAYFEASGLPAVNEVLAVDVGALAERNALLGEASLEDTKAYLQWELLRHSAPYLSPQFVAAFDSFNSALYGLTEAPKREQAVAAEVARRLGQPLGRLYVEQRLSPEDKARAEQLVASIRREFRSHLEQNAWLTAPTRQYAIEKLDKMTIVVGYPDKWIDYSSVDVRRDDYYGNMVRLNEFAARRANAKFGKPVDEDEFNDPRSTLPTVVNAAYTPERNDIEIPAAFLQPPFFDAKADAAVNYCTLGAVIGHEITHGFDSQGRLYDAEGEVRDWWAPQDARQFVARTQPIVDRASAYEVLPGVQLNGQLAVGENLADAGGLMLGYEALQQHLAAHPAENRRIDGYTPQQRCFIAWAQNWADKMNEAFLRQIAASDPHPPGMYRTIAPAQNLVAFYAAFGIRPGDKMWLDPKARAKVW